MGEIPAELLALGNVRFLPPQPRSRIPDFVAALDVAVTPYLDCRINRRCYPLKVMDALALGVPPVYTPWRDDLTELAPYVRYARDSTGFILAVEDALAGDRPPRGAIRERGWDRVTERFLDLTQPR